MIRYFFIFIFLLQATGLFCQLEKSVYSSKQDRWDLKKIKKEVGIKKLNELSLSELNTVLSKYVYTGKKIHDSIAKLRFHQTYYYHKRDYINNLKIRLKLHAQYSEYFTKTELGTSLSKISNAYHELGEINLSIDFSKRSIKYFNTNKRLFLVHNQLAISYVKLKESNAAIYHFKEAKKHVQTQENKLRVFNSLGFVYFLKNDLKKANQFYQKALAIFSNDHDIIDSIQYGIIQSNLFDIEMKNDNIGKAKLIIKEILSSNYLVRKGNNFFKKEIYVKYVSLNLKDENCGESELYLSKLYTYIRNNKKTSKDRVRYFELKVQHAHHCKDAIASQNSFKVYLKELKELKRVEVEQSNIIDDIVTGMHQEQISLVHKNLLLEKESQQSLKLSNVRLKQLIGLSIFIFIVVTVVLFYWHFQRKKRHENNEVMLELKGKLLKEKENSFKLNKEIVNQELKNQELELSQILNEANKENMLSKEIEDRLTQMKKTDKNLQADITQLLLFIRSKKKNEDFNKLISEKSYLLRPEFKEKLNNKFNYLTKSEIQLFTLIRIGLSTKEIAQFRNIEPTSVRTLKYRLKLKMGVEKNVNLTDYIKDI